MIRTQINPYLVFDGNCADAMTFYHECLGGELTLQTVGESPMAGQFPPEMHERILHSSLVKDGLILLASDMAGSEGVWQGNSIALSLLCSTEEEIYTFFANLSRGANVTRPLHPFFAGTIGALTDRYGIDWIIKL